METGDAIEILKEAIANKTIDFNRIIKTATDNEELSADELDWLKRIELLSIDRRRIYNEGINAEWISVYQTIPVGIDVLVIGPSIMGTPWKAQWRNRGWFTNIGRIPDGIVTHWKALPNG